MERILLKIKCVLKLNNGRLWLKFFDIKIVDGCFICFVRVWLSNIVIVFKDFLCLWLWSLLNLEDLRSLNKWFGRNLKKVLLSFL